MRATCGTTTATSGPDDSTINLDGRHDNGDFDGRHDDDKGQQSNRPHDDGDERAG